MRTQNTLTFYEYISKRLKGLNARFALVVVLLIAITVFLQTFISIKENNIQSVLGISSYIENLVSINDRSELQKILKSLASSHGTKLRLIRDNRILSSSESLEELDQEMLVKNNIQLYGFYTWIDQKDGTKVAIFSSWAPIVEQVLLLTSLLSVSILIVLFLYFRRLQTVIGKSLSPLENLQHDINGLLSGKFIETSPLQIEELESIRLTLFHTFMELENAKEVLANEKAKKLSSDAYKRLIHDLHNPVSALRNSINIATNMEFDEVSRSEAMNIIPIIAEQLLLQVKSAKKNLEFESINLQNKNLNECLEQCLYLISANNKENKKIIAHCEDQNIVIPHDPILLQRAILNLMENGLEFSKEKIEISTKKYDDYISIEVSDDGCGMNRDDIATYFQGRGKSSKADREAYGLSSTNHIARIHGGKLIYSKNKNGGASFEIRLGV